MAQETKSPWGMYGSLGAMTKFHIMPLVSTGVPVDGVIGTGTFAGAAGKGALLIDVTNGELYINKGTQASPAWKKVTTS